MTTDISQCGVVELTRAEASKTSGGIAPVVAVGAAAALGACLGIVLTYGMSFLLNLRKHH
ncbi:class IIb bacteriocin, lactobin A/cerein 7B family [Rhizobium leguminosarum]|uniref:Class IIb bacteriocin, lactobin A/cerein 7B family n=1 Tax=Rhizobium ruizarguesonis TaxID=2081791 RepID=A0AAE4YV43_9HYPH|nr:class IIb bacteriocin, lactobin A/cerein 7B family [Rhizobium ruizarguesonis]